MNPSKLIVRSLDYYSPDTNVLVTAREVTDDCEIVAGQTVGPFSLEVVDECDQPLPASLLTQATVRMDLTDENDKTYVTTVSQFTEKTGFWFKEYEGLKRAGVYVLSFTLDVGQDAECQSVSHEIPFHVIPCPEIISIQTPKPTECHRIGQAFDINLTLMDQFDNVVSHVNEEFRSSISSTGMDFSVTRTVTDGGNVRLEGVIAVGKIDQLNERSVPLVMIEAEVSLKTADASDEVFRVKIQLKFKAGEPDTLQLVDPADGESCVIENGTLPQFGVKVLDAFGNMVTTAIEPNLEIKVVFGEQSATGGRKDWLAEYTLSFMTGPNGSPCDLKGGPSLKVDLDEVCEKKLYARLFVSSHPAVKPVHCNVLIRKCSKPSDIRIFCSSEFDADTICEIRNGETMNWTASQMIRNVSFKMMDAEKNVIAKPNLTFSNFRVSWLSAEWVPSGSHNQKSLSMGKLPDIRAPKTDGETAVFNVTFYEASSGTSVKNLCSRVDDSSISFQFSIKATVGAPVHLIASICGDNKVKSSVPMEGFIMLHAEDAVFNRITDITQEDVDALTVVPVKGKLDPDSLSKEKGLKPGDVFLKGVSVSFDEDMTMLPLVINFLSLSATVTLEVMAGLPAKLAWILPKNVTHDAMRRIFVTNGQPIGPWSVQVTDKFGKATKYAGLVVSAGFSKSFNATTETSKPITNSEGIASFGLMHISAKDGKGPTMCQICGKLCYGQVSVQAKVDFEGLAVITAPIKLHFKCNPRIISEIAVAFDGLTKESYDASLAAGSQFPELTVTLRSEDGTLIKSEEMLSSVLMITTNTSSTAMSKSYLAPNLVDGSTGRAKFQGVLVPSQAAHYTMVFLTKQWGGEDLFSTEFSYSVVAADPRSFKPQKIPSSPWVSNSGDRIKRMIAPALTFVLEDEFQNVITASQDSGDCSQYDGVLTFKLEASDMSDEILPQLETTSLSTPIMGGKATSDPLYLAEKTVGQNGKSYKIVCHADFPALGFDLPDFVITFHFVDDSQKHEQLNIMKTRREKLMMDKGIFSKEFTAMNKEYQHLRHMYESSTEKLQTREDEFFAQNNDLMSKIREGYSFESLIRDVEADLFHLNSSANIDPNLKRVVPAPDEVGVVGRVIHLGRARSEADAPLISWIMMSDMKCIIIESTERALNLMKSDRKQQVLSLEMVRPTEWDAKLPHEKCDPPIQVTGNPVYARHLLHFPDKEKKCRLAFGSLIGDTIVFASLEDAVSYRNQLLERGLQCPDLVTRNGEKITSGGKVISHSLTGGSDGKMLRFHCVPVNQMSDLKLKLESLRDLRELSEARQEVAIQLQTFEDAHGTRMSTLCEHVAQLEKELKGIEQEERELSRKRSSTNFDSPAFKRFC